MLSIFIPCIFKFKGKSETSVIKCTKSIFKDYFILLLFGILIFGSYYLIDYLSINALYLDITWIRLSFDMIFYLLLSIIILKTKYYIHNIISLILFCVFTVINDFIFENYKYFKLSSFLSLLPYFLNDLAFCYIKYLIDKKLHSYWNILFFIGLFRFLIYSITFIIYIIKDPYNNYIFINIRKAKTKYIILNFFNEAILDIYLRKLLLLLILEHFSFNHVHISSELYFIVINIIDIIWYHKNKKYYFFLIPTFFQILSLLFYLEILEFNFCNLNRNTKRNIMLREEEEMLLRSNTNESEIEIDNDLIIKNPQEKKELELYDITDDSGENEKNNEN